MQIGGSDLPSVQIKNIKLHIVTDIKVTINSLSVFGFRYLEGGRDTVQTNEKLVKVSPTVMQYVSDYFQCPRKTYTALVYFGL